MVQEVIVFVLFFAFCFLEHLAVFFIEALVKLLTCSRPAVVAPQPIGWLLSDGVLEASHICLGDAILAKLFRMAGDEFHLTDIVSSLWSRHLTVENSLFTSLADTKEYAAAKGIHKIYVVGEEQYQIEL